MNYGRRVCDIVQETGIKTIPIEKKCKKAKWLSGEALQIADGKPQWGEVFRVTLHLGRKLCGFEKNEAHGRSGEKTEIRKGTSNSIGVGGTVVRSKKQLLHLLKVRRCMAHVPGEEARRSTLAAAKRGTGELGRDRNREGAQPCQCRERKRESVPNRAKALPPSLASDRKSVV